MVFDISTFTFICRIIRGILCKKNYTILFKKKVTFISFWRFRLEKRQYEKIKICPWNHSTFIWNIFSYFQNCGCYNCGWSVLSNWLINSPYISVLNFCINYKFRWICLYLILNLFLIVTASITKTSHVHR